MGEKGTGRKGSKMIQIFGKNKCFDTRAAKRFFAERGIRIQYIDLMEKGMSQGEFDSAARAVGGQDKLIDETAKDFCDIKYLVDADKKGKLDEEPKLYRTPIVRRGSRAAVGNAPDAWAEFAAAEKAAK